MAPWPGFEPGSGGRQPPILGLTILPGHPIPLKRMGLVLKFFIPKKIISTINNPYYQERWRFLIIKTYNNFFNPI